jgi:hypothetical protein
MRRSRWRGMAAPVVAAVLAETAGQEEKAIRKALREAYPFGERRRWPYRAWLKEVHAQRGTTKCKPGQRPRPYQLPLPLGDIR